MSLVAATPGVGCTTVVNDSLCLFMPENIELDSDVIHQTFSQNGGLRDELAVAAQKLFSPKHRQLLYSSAQGHLGLNSLMALTNNGLNHNHSDDTSFVPKVIHRPLSHSNHSYVGLPYQDHNYVAPYPCSPPQSPVVTLNSGPKFTGFNSANIHHGNVSNCNSSGHLTPTVASAGLEELEYHAAASGVGVREVIVTTTVPMNGSSLQDNSNGDDSVTRCICDFQHDDGYMICCDQCGVWQHVDCMRVDRENIPDSYLCEICEPRSVDKHRAIQIQTRKRDDLSLLPIDSSATETEDETTQDDMVMYPARKKIRRDSDENVRRRVKRSLKDESPKKRAHFKTRGNGLLDSKVFPSPQKPLVPILNADRDELHTVFGVGHIANATEALFAAVDCVTSYCDATTNSYSPELEALLPNIRFNGQHTSGNSHRPFTVGCAEIDSQLADRQPCHVAQVAGGKKMGLEATEDIITHQPLIEFIGKVMLRDQYDSEVNSLLSIQPYVLFYTKLEGLDLCVDARQYGNEARFVRRSCTPNAEVRHVLDGHSLRFFLHATKSIIRGAEITIPFDINYHKCVGLRRHRLTRSVDTKPVASQPVVDQTIIASLPTTPMKTVPPSPTVLSGKQKRPPPLNVIAANGQSVNGLTVSTTANESIDVQISSSSKSTPIPATSPSKSSRQNLGTPNHVTVSSVPITTDVEHSSAVHAGNSDSDTSDKSKKKTREEKKLEAILKTIEKMEKREERKKEALARLDNSKKLNCKDKDTKLTDSDQCSANVAVVKDQKKSMSGDEDRRPQPTKSKKNRQHITTANRRSSVSVVSTPTTSQTATLTPTSLSVVTAVSKNPPSTTSATGIDDSCSELISSACKVSPEVTSICMMTPVAMSVSTATTAPSAELMRLPKKLLMRDRDRGGQRNMVMRSTSESSDIRQPLTVQTDCSNDTPANGNDLSEFMPCRPSPHSHTLSSLRRLSVPACGQSKVTVALGQNCNNGGSAKKRWLQKAMHESTTASSCTSFGAAAIMSLSSQGTYCVSSLASSLSPSAGDFVTPLKKRRLARESLSMDDSLPGVLEEDTCGSTTAQSVSPVGIATPPGGELAHSSVGIASGGYSTAELFSDGTISEASLDSHEEAWSKYVRRKNENDANVAKTSLPATFDHWHVPAATATSTSANQAARTLLSAVELVSDLSADESQCLVHVIDERQTVSEVASLKQEFICKDEPLLSPGNELTKSNSDVSNSCVKAEPYVNEAVSLSTASLQATGSLADVLLSMPDKVSTNPVNCFQMVVKSEKSDKVESLPDFDNFAVTDSKQRNEVQSDCNVLPVSEFSVVVSSNARLTYCGTNEGHQTTTSLGDLISRIERRPLSSVPVDMGLCYPKFSSVEDSSLLSKSQSYWTLIENKDENREVKLTAAGSLTASYMHTEFPTSSPGKNWYESVTHASGDAIVPSVLDGLAKKPDSDLLGWTSESGSNIRNLSADDAKTSELLIVHPVQSQMSELYLSPSQTLTFGLPECEEKNYSSDGSRLTDCCSDSEHGDKQLSSTQVAAPILPKKKVSLLEYRQRKSQRSGDSNSELHAVCTSSLAVLPAGDGVLKAEFDPDDAKNDAKSSTPCQQADDSGLTAVVVASQIAQHLTSAPVAPLSISENSTQSPVFSDLTVSCNQEHLNSLTDRDATG